MLRDFDEWLDARVRLLQFGNVERDGEDEPIDSWEALVTFLYELAGSSEAEARLVDDLYGLATGDGIRAVAEMSALRTDQATYGGLQKKLAKLAGMVDRAGAADADATTVGGVAIAAESRDADADFRPVEHTRLRSMDEIFGAEREKRELIVQFVRPVLYDKIMAPFNSMLLYGPPGTGKTFFAMAAARTMQDVAGKPVFFFAPSSGSYQGKFLGATQKRLRAVFRTAHDTARASGPQSRSLLFMDEFESLAKSRAKNAGDLATSASVPELLQLTDGATSFDNVVLMAATNLPWMIDSAMMRRFDARLFVDLPTRKARQLAVLNVLRKYFHLDEGAAARLRNERAVCDPTSKRRNRKCMDAVTTFIVRTGFSRTFLPRLESYLRRVGVSTANNQAYASWYHSHFGADNYDVSGTRGRTDVPYSMSDMVKVVERAVNLYANHVINTKMAAGEPASPADMQRLEWEYKVGGKTLRFQEAIDAAMVEYPSTVNPDEYAALVAYYINGEEPPRDVRLLPYVEDDGADEDDDDGEYDEY